MSQPIVARTMVDSVRYVVILDGHEASVLSDLGGALEEVGKGTWDGSTFTCKAWLGRDVEHDLMAQAAVRRAVVEAVRDAAQTPTVRT